MSGALSNRRRGFEARSADAPHRPNTLCRPDTPRRRSTLRRANALHRLSALRRPSEVRSARRMNTPPRQAGRRTPEEDRSMTTKSQQESRHRTPE